MFARSSLSALAALTVLVTLSGCSSEVEEDDLGETEGANTSTRPGAAPIGVPKTLAQGEQRYGGTGQALHIKKADGSELVRQASGYQTMTVTGGGVTFGTLDRSADQNTGWSTGAQKWKCVDAEKFATDAVTLTDPNQLCEVEINPTGGNGFSITIIGLDANGQGLTRYTPSQTGSSPAPFNGGAVHPVASGPAPGVNVTIDHDAVLDAMVAAKQQFNRVPKGERNDCLKNARASSWLDIQAHYYCLLPYGDLRTCYSTKLIEEATSGDPNRAKAAALTAYATCIAPPAAGQQDRRTASAKWIHENQEAAFKYVMFTKQGVRDYEVVSENKTISDFYTRIGETRPRRVNDTFPAWLPNQPRYEAIRKLQYDAQQAAPSNGGR